MEFYFNFVIVFRPTLYIFHFYRLSVFYTCNSPILYSSKSYNCTLLLPHPFPFHHHAPLIYAHSTWKTSKKIHFYVFFAVVVGIKKLTGGRRITPKMFHQAPVYYYAISMGQSVKLCLFGAAF